MAELDLPSGYGGFSCFAKVVLDVPARTLLPHSDLRSSHGVYWCERFWKKIFPELASKHADKPPKEAVAACGTAASVFFWRCETGSVRYDDVERRFKGKDSPVPWWGLNLLLHRHYYAPTDLPFSLSSNRLMAFMPIRGRSKEEASSIAFIHVYGRVSTSTSPEWWVDEYEKGDNGKAACPTDAVYLSWQRH